jgi:hypothetical protein
MSSIDSVSPINFPINVFKNQFDFGKTIADAFSNDSNLIYFLAFALTQSGKTGSMLSMIHHFLNNPSLSIPLDNVFTLTGISSTDWVSQTRERFPTSLHHRIYHRNNLLHFFNDIEHKDNVLVIIDESHIATKNDQTMSSIFKFLHFDDSDYLLRHNIKFVFFTATPTNIPFFMNNPFASMAKMTPPPQYTSIFDLLKSNRILPFKDLCGADIADQASVRHNVIELKDFILSSFDAPLYHIIRTHNSTKQNITLYHFQKVWKDDARIILDSPQFDLNKLLSKPPTIHTFIFIKERLRCAKTIVKKFIGVLYERITHKPNLNSIIQGLAGRATGYDSGKHLVVFTHLESIVDYFHIWHNNIFFKHSDSIFY